MIIIIIVIDTGWWWGMSVIIMSDNYHRHWAQMVGAGVCVLCSVVGLVLFGLFSSLDTSKKALIICCVAIFEAILIK